MQALFVSSLHLTFFSCHYFCSHVHVCVVVNFSLCVAAAPQGKSNTNFANFDAFGNTAIPSHQSTSSPSKSFSSGTTHPAIFFSILPTHPHPHCSTVFFYSFLTHCVHWAKLPVAFWMLWAFADHCCCCCYFSIYFTTF